MAPEASVVNWLLAVLLVAALVGWLVVCDLEKSDDDDDFWLDRPYG